MIEKYITKTIAIPQVRLSYPHLFAKSPNQIINGVTINGKYQAQLILDKTDKRHAEAIEKMLEAAKEITGGVGIRKLPRPLVKDNDEELEGLDDESRANRLYLVNTWQFSTTNNNAPKLELIKRVRLNPAVDENPFYPGCYVNVAITMAPYKLNNKWAGVSKYLEYVLFSKHGESFLGKPIDGASFFSDDICVTDTPEKKEDNNDDIF